jgi:hypothetical protein
VVDKNRNIDASPIKTKRIDVDTYAGLLDVKFGKKNALILTKVL